MKFYRNYSRFLLLGFLGLGLGSGCQTKVNKAGDQPSNNGEEDPEGDGEHPKDFAPDKLVIAPITLLKSGTTELVPTNFYATPGLKASPVGSGIGRPLFPNILALGVEAQEENIFTIVAEISKNHYFVITEMPEQLTETQLFPAFLEANPTKQKKEITFSKTETAISVYSNFLKTPTPDLKVSWSVINGMLSQEKNIISLNGDLDEYSLIAKVKTSKNEEKFFYYFCPKSSLYDALKQKALDLNDGKGFTLTKLYEYLLATNTNADEDMKINKKIITEITALRAGTLEHFKK